MLKSFCRYCWKETETWYGENAEHIEARCKVCGGWVKFLTRQEIRKLIGYLLGKTIGEKPQIGRNSPPRNAPIIKLKKPPSLKEVIIKRSKMA